jgi:GTP-binding protein
MEWLDTMEDYLTNKQTIADVLLLINGHLPPQKVDMLMISALEESKMAYTIIVTKTDKVAMKKVSKNIKELKAFYQEHNYTMPEVLYTSSTKKQGAP